MDSVEQGLALVPSVGPIGDHHGNEIEDSVDHQARELACLMRHTLDEVLSQGFFRGRGVTASTTMFAATSPPAHTF